LNTDGSVINASGSAAAGGVIREEDGRFVSAFTANLGGGSITRAELMAIVIGLRAAWEVGARKVEVQTDSRVAIDLVQAATESSPHYQLVMQVRRLLERAWQVVLKHIYREANAAADFLASKGHSHAVGEHMIQTPTDVLNFWLLHDCMGVQTPRLITY
ncbi:unnamed protein product, partial [Linum tenue]